MALFSRPRLPAARPAIQPCGRLSAPSPSPAAPCSRPRRGRAAGRAALGSSAAAASHAGAQAERLLDAFWKARGVVDEELRRRLVAAAAGCEEEAAAPAYQLSSQDPLPGIHAAWFFEDAAATTLPQVREVSRRLLALHQLLGAREDVDVVWMVVREPGLLSADFRSIMRRLLDMRVSEGVEGVDVVRLVEGQPSLLLQQGVQVSSTESAGERLQAWQHGLVTDSLPEWERRFQQLEQYRQQHGDPHVGYREEDDVALGNWVAKQRSAARGGQLEQAKRDRLEALGFEFDEERSEWLRWFNELRAFRDREGHTSPAPLAAGNDFLLLNWCAVQRIAKRSRVLADDRAELLDSLGFDWSGADALS